MTLREAAQHLGAEILRKPPQTFADVRSIVVNLSPSDATKVILNTSLLDALKEFTLSDLFDLLEVIETVTEENS